MQMQALSLSGHQQAGPPADAIYYKMLLGGKLKVDLFWYTVVMTSVSLACLAFWLWANVDTAAFVLANCHSPMPERASRWPAYVLTAVQSVGYIIALTANGVLLLALRRHDSSDRLRNRAERVSLAGEDMSALVHVSNRS